MTDDDRAQLLLVGAVATAIVLLGLVVVFNTVLFTETQTSTESLKSASEAQSYTDQVRRDTKAIMFHVANETSHTSGLSVTGCSTTVGGVSVSNRGECWVVKNVTRYSQVLATSYANTGPVFVNVSVESVTMTPTDLEATVEIVYETNSFRYVRTVEVSRDAP